MGGRQLGPEDGECLVDLVEGGGVPFIKSATMDFQALVTGPVLSTAVLVDDPDSVRAHYADRGSASFDVEVLFHRESDQVQTSVMRPRMTLKRLQ